MGIEDSLGREFEFPYIISVTFHNVVFIAGNEKKLSIWMNCNTEKALKDYYKSPKCSLHKGLSKFPDLDKMNDIFDMLKGSYEDQLLAIKWIEAGYLD